MNKTKFKIGDKVKLKYPNNIDGYIDYDDAWKKWWYDNENTIFSIYHITTNPLPDELFMDDSPYYNLICPDGKIVMSPSCKKYRAAFSDDELKLYITNPLPDDLFVVE